MPPPRDVLHFPDEQAKLLTPYLPSFIPSSSSLPLVTLTFATSLDSSISLRPGVQTPLSGPQSKAMTHYLRSKHDAILIGVNTAVTDNPSLNCRIAGAAGYGGNEETLELQPIPVIIDPNWRWEIGEDTKVLKLGKERKGRGPLIIVREDSVLTEERRRREGILNDHAGEYLRLPIDSNGRFSWEEILKLLKSRDIRSVMIEGGAKIINSLLEKKDNHLVNSVIVTIAPVWLGEGSVLVSPRQEESTNEQPVARLLKPSWIPLGDDVVLCGFLH